MKSEEQKRNEINPKGDLMSSPPLISKLCVTASLERWHCLQEGGTPMLLGVDPVLAIILDAVITQGPLRLSISL